MRKVTEDRMTGIIHTSRTVIGYFYLLLNGGKFSEEEFCVFFPGLNGNFAIG